MENRCKPVSRYENLDHIQEWDEHAAREKWCYLTYRDELMQKTPKERDEINRMLSFEFNALSRIGIAECLIKERLVRVMNDTLFINFIDEDENTELNRQIYHDATTCEFEIRSIWAVENQ